MISKEDVIHAANANGFEDVGFTTAQPFDSHQKFLIDHAAEYGWAEKYGDGLIKSTDPKATLPAAKSIIVLMEVYVKCSYPGFMTGHFGRCYLDDDRVIKKGSIKRLRAFHDFLRNNGIASKSAPYLPHRMAALRAGMGTLGKNCLFYSNKVARRSSWVSPMVIVADHEFPPDDPTTETYGCPAWCRNACIAACPTRALKGNATIEPQKCISFLSYFSEELTPAELRDPMGINVYGCDRCQNVCPRNIPWLAQTLPMNDKIDRMQKDFGLSQLLSMDTAFFKTQIWPHMFYMSSDEIWRWKMNAARAMGNTTDRKYTTDLIRALKSEPDERIRGMAAWALGKLGGNAAKNALEAAKPGSDGVVYDEIIQALNQLA